MTTLTPEPRERTVQIRRLRPERVPAETIAQVRAFSRFFTKHVGIRRSAAPETPWPHAHARVLCELGQTDAMAMADLRQALDMDGGQLSRILTALVGDDLVSRSPAPDDGRCQVVSLTSAGRQAATQLESRSKEQITAQLARLSPREQRELVSAMATVRRLFGDPRTPPSIANSPHRVTLRAPRAGDLGWIVERHGALYAAECGWNQTFEASVAEIVAEHARSAAVGRDRAWIADVDGRRVGSVLCGAVDGTTAKLRLLLVEPSARGHGVGRRLVQASIDFARASGYRRLILRTNDGLTSARGICEGMGFTLLHSGVDQDFGVDLLGQTWERAL